MKLKSRLNSNVRAGNVVLMFKSLGINNLMHFEFLEPPVLHFHHLCMSALGLLSGCRRSKSSLSCTAGLSRSFT